MMVEASPDTLSPLRAEAVAIDDLFGWFSPGIGRRGVVLCGATGFEQLAAHRSWRDLAGRIAATGCATLRFDYPGEGDSGDAGAESVAAWVGAIRRAIRFLREEAGAEEIVLVGLRLGGTLAVLAAQEGGVDRLALLAPCRTGRAYLREMRLRAPAINALPDGATPAQEPGHLSVGGFRFGPGLVRDLSAIDLAGIAVPPAPKILLLGAESDDLARRCEALGSDVARGPLHGLALLVGNPLFSETPEDAFSTVVDFVAQGALPRPSGPGSVLAPARIDGAGWREEAVRFGPDLFGVHGRSSGAARGGPTVLFVQAGLSVHSGWGRQTTVLARRLAARGVASLRMDLRGVGESPDRPARTSPLFAPDAPDDIGHALDHLAARGTGPVVVVGTCSGAYAAFHAACRDHRIAGALLVNLYCFDWHPDDEVDAVIRGRFGRASTYAALLARGATWRRLLRREIRVAAIGGALARGGLHRIKRRWTGLFRPGPAGGSVARRVDAIRRRGAHLRLVYCAGDPGLPAVRKLGRSPERVARRLGAPVAIIPGTDHNLGTPDAQDRLAAILLALVDTVANGH
ncbi:alpha/beta fold hydrolase [uncultured Methylobacterium sp.]|uniref:alpha/beta fold hydrolase n=1 Tax=uncultured Methylobacterium sp. TaxID=157278 RepID=UPI0035C9703B